MKFKLCVLTCVFCAESTKHTKHSGTTRAIVSTPWSLLQCRLWLQIALPVQEPVAVNMGMTSFSGQPVSYHCSVYFDKKSIELFQWGNWRFVILVFCLDNLHKLMSLFLFKHKCNGQKCSVTFELHYGHVTTTPSLLMISLWRILESNFATC